MSKTLAPMMEHDWQAESDFGHLERAEEVKSDKPRHARALSFGKTKVAGMRKVMARGQRLGVMGGEGDLSHGFRRLGGK